MQNKFLDSTACIKFQTNEVYYEILPHLLPWRKRKQKQMVCYDVFETKLQSKARENTPFTNTL